LKCEKGSFFLKKKRIRRAKQARTGFRDEVGGNAKCEQSEQRRRIFPKRSEGGENLPKKKTQSSRTRKQYAQKECWVTKRLRGRRKRINKKGKSKEGLLKTGGQKTTMLKGKNMGDGTIGKGRGKSAQDPCQG